MQPSEQKSNNPSPQPGVEPIWTSTPQPTSKTSEPTRHPSVLNNDHPSPQPSAEPTWTTQPSSMLTSDPTEQPSVAPSKGVVTRHKISDTIPPTLSITRPPTVTPSEVSPTEEVHKFLGGLAGLLALSIFGVWGFLRSLPYCVGLIVIKKKGCHVYDILVIVDDSEELVLKNIRHEDIAYFRKTEVLELTWEVNDTNDVITKRSEVEFFDRYNLMGRGLDTNGNEKGTCSMDFMMSKDKAAWRESHTHQSSLETGMIIRVNPGNPIPHSILFLT
jgi:hypothetical protein